MSDTVFGFLSNKYIADFLIASKKTSRVFDNSNWSQNWEATSLTKSKLLLRFLNKKKNKIKGKKIKKIC